MNEQKEHVDEEKVTRDEMTDTEEVVSDTDVMEEDNHDEQTPVQDERSKTKTYIAIIIALAGIASGSLFVDVAQLFSQKGFSARAMRDAQVVEYDGKTWVRYDDPKVVVDVFDAEDCAECVTDEVLTQLRTVLPTMEAHYIDINSEEGKAYAKMHNIAYVPAFLFSQPVTETDFYQQAALLFKESKDKYYLDTASAGIPVGKYIAQPSATEGMLFGDPNASTQVVIFADLTSPESKALHDVIAQVRTTYGEKIVVAVKFLADPEQKTAQRVALGATCAYAQDKYEPFFNTYFVQRQRLTDEKTIDDELKKIAKTAQLNEEQFASCMGDQQKVDALATFVDEAKRFGIQMLPTAFVNEEVLTDKITVESLSSKIDARIGSEEEKQ